MAELSREARRERRRDEARAAIRTVLEQCAAKRGRITYGELARQANERVHGLRLYATNKELWHLLSEIAAEEVREGRPMLPAIVVHKTGDHEPGRGFFELARELGRMRPDQDETDFAESETRAVFERWAPARTSRR